MNEKKKKLLDELTKDCESEIKEEKSKLLPIGVFFFLGGILALIAANIEASSGNFDRYTGGFVGVSIAAGIIGIIGGIYVIIRYFKLLQDGKRNKNS